MTSIGLTAAAIVLSTLAFTAASREVAPAVCVTSGAIGADTALAAVYQDGKSWESFLADVDRRRDLWLDTWHAATVPEQLATRARGAGEWRLLVITVPGCSDS